MERNKVVSNGCSGNCCEKFTLPVTLWDIQMMKFSFIEQRLNAHEQELHIYNIPLKKIKCENGVIRSPAPEEDIDKLLAMLIPLGKTKVCPQDEIEWNSKHSKLVIECDDEVIREKLNNHFHVENGDIQANIFTCKHFDTKKRICTNYENRPWLCKEFGSHCSYKGCNYLTEEKIIEKTKKDFEIKSKVEDISDDDWFYLGLTSNIEGDDEVELYIRKQKVIKAK